MNIHIIYGLIVAITLIIFLVTLFCIGGKKKVTKSSKMDDSQLKGPKMAEKKNSLKKSEAKVLAATMIKDLVEEERNDVEAMEERLDKLNLTESGERKFHEALDEMLAVVLKKAKIEVK